MSPLNALETTVELTVLLQKQKDAAYAERNQVVAALGKMVMALGYKVVVTQHEGAEWEDDWRTILLMELPTGQVTWHFHDSEKHLLESFPRGQVAWDGHSTEEKYNRLNKLEPWNVLQKILTTTVKP